MVDSVGETFERRCERDAVVEVGHAGTSEARFTWVNEF